MKHGFLITVAVISLVSFTGGLFVKASEVPQTRKRTLMDSTPAQKELSRIIPLPPQPVVKRQSDILTDFAKYFQQPLESLYEKKIAVRSGHTLITLLQEAGAERMDAYLAVKALSEVCDPRNLQPGQEVTGVLTDGAEAQSPEFVGMHFRPAADSDVILYRDADGNFVAEKSARELYREQVYAGAEIQTSVFDAGAQAGVPAGILLKMIRSFSYNVDFQRDLREGDAIEVYFERYIDKEGKLARTGDMLFAALDVGGKLHKIYRYKPAQGAAEYFDKNGRGIKKALLRTPVDSARISSGFGLRMHPVLGYTKMHRGVDFAAPTGTPIYAAGNGIIARMGPFMAYGNYVRINHNSEMGTAYGHMSAFRRGLRVGSRVKQGEVIGYVGTTGRSTGPHLHYEVLRRNVQVNPSALNLPVGTQLNSAELNRFKDHVASMEIKMGVIKNTHNPAVAANNPVVVGRTAR